MKKSLLVFPVLFFSIIAEAAFSPAATVTFADFKTISAQVQAVGKSMKDPVLGNAIPAAIRNHDFTKMFGPMPVGSVGAAVLYADAAVVAALIDAGADAAARARMERQLDRAKRWAILYLARKRKKRSCASMKGAWRLKA